MQPTRCIVLTLLVGTVFTAEIAGCTSGEKFESLEELEAGVTPEERAEHMTVLMTNALGLTEEQIPRVERINLQYAKGLDWVSRKKYERSRKKSYYIRDIRAQRDASLRTAMTAEQYAQYKLQREELTEQLIEDFELKAQ